jgi:hypothetical protein
MKMENADDELLRSLRSLGVAEPDATRVERVRRRCHASLVQRRQRAERETRRAGFAARVLEPALIGALSASYLLAILFVLLRLHGVR